MIKNQISGKEHASKIVFRTRNVCGSFNKSTPDYKHNTHNTRVVLQSPSHRVSKLVPRFSLLPFPWSEREGNLSNYDGDVNENATKQKV